MLDEIADSLLGVIEIKARYHFKEAITVLLIEVPLVAGLRHLARSFCKLVIVGSWT